MGGALSLEGGWMVGGGGAPGGCLKALVSPDPTRQGPPGGPGGLEGRVAPPVSTAPALSSCRSLLFARRTLRRGRGAEPQHEIVGCPRFHLGRWGLTLAALIHQISWRGITPEDNPTLFLRWEAIKATLVKHDFPPVE